ncbi:MAG: hypothetical protein M5U12_01585 [Verrucomicrobia bacterium]|nr:hypothetical protein [Verrucomicrobiota bacterium]
MNTTLLLSHRSSPGAEFAGLLGQRWPVVPPSLRTPPRPENRAYLRALRAAEAAAWEAQDRTKVRTTPRLEAEDVAEGRWFVVLGLIGAGTVAYGLWTTGWLFQNWDRFLALAHRLLG